MNEIDSVLIGISIILLLMIALIISINNLDKSLRRTYTYELSRSAI